jgi:ABC-type polysaccharide/polyol phosphate transport system ATPase subunit
MFGIVGRNGSGKSTLLKILASIYDPDAGTIRMAGRRAPFVELGAGFHPELTAWDNVRTSSVMMGLTPKQARERFDAIIEFAELQDFQGLELKNYSAGMRTRLTFATLLKVDADIFLFDEILAAGDAKFHEKSAAAFKDLCEGGKTVVLASHSLSAVRRECDRALLLHQGTVERIGDPEDVTAHYLELVHGQGQRQRRASRPPLSTASARQGPAAEITRVWVEDSAGRIASSVPSGTRLEVHALVEVSRGGK